MGRERVMDQGCAPGTGLAGSSDIVPGVAVEMFEMIFIGSF